MGRAMQTAMLFGGALALAPASAAALDDYDDCLAMIASDPAQAEREAARWVSDGGGAAARHCRALALTGLGADLQAATELTEIVRTELDLPPRVQADLLAQAGRLYLDRGEAVAAERLARRAIAIDREHRDALSLAASARIDQGDPQGALDFLDRAVIIRGDAPILALRSEVRRGVGDLVGARDDGHRATEAAPGDAEGWLALGSAEAALDNRDGARKAWLQAIRIDPESDTAESARLRLQRMELGVD